MCIVMVSDVAHEAGLVRVCEMETRPVLMYSLLLQCKVALIVISVLSLLVVI